MAVVARDRTEASDGAERERQTESGQSSHCQQEEQSRAVGSHHEKGSHWPTDV